MVTISLIALFIYVLGAFAYGSALLLSVRQAFPVWSPPRPHGAAPGGTLGRASLVLFAWSAAYFVVGALMEVRWLVGGSGFRVFDIAGLLLTYGFPPLIMHIVYDEVRLHAATGHRPVWRWLLAAMYVVAPLTGLGLLGMRLSIIPSVGVPDGAIGWSIGALFTLCSAYCVVLMVQGRGARGREAPRGHNTMIALFGVMTVAILVLTFMRDQQVLIFAVERLVRTAPLAFLVAAIYFESPFVFYDLVVKRGAQLLASLLVVGGLLVASLPWLDQVPPGVSRPWLLALAAMPVAMFVPWMHTQVGRLLDLVWFGRAYTPAEAVRVVLASLQRATDERTLLSAAEAGFADIFRVPVGLRTAAPPDHAHDLTIPVQGADETPVLWITARQETGHLLSEDQALLRSLGTVVAYLLENLRLHERRKAQEQVEQALRLQTSRSELKALRAQINPHFLFNALNAIASLIHTDPARADSAVEQLAEVFRYTLRRSESEWAPLDQEIAFVQAYLDVEHARFGRRLTYTIDADPGGRGVQVPSMVLHTLVENAVKHGISAQRTPGHILVRTVIGHGRIRLEVHDTGPGPSPEGAAPGLRPDGERFGLRSIRDRLAGHFGEAATLTLTRDDPAATTVACVEMPAGRGRTT